MFVNLLNVSIINVMLPKIMAEFQVPASTAQWLSTGFMLLTGIIITLVPFLSKRLQYRTLFNAAMVFMVIGSLLCAVSPSFIVLLTGRLVQAVGLILMPIYFENVMGYSGLKTGMLLLPGSLLIGIMGIFSGKLYDKIGIKPLAVTGTLIMAAAAVFLARLTPDTTYMGSLLSYTAFAFGVSIVTTPITTAAFAKVPKEQNSDAATLQNTLRQIAGSIGTAILITVMSNSAKDFAANRAGAADQQTPVLAANHGINTAFILTIALCLLAAALSFALASKKKLAVNAPVNAAKVNPTPTNPAQLGDLRGCQASANGIAY